VRAVDEPDGGLQAQFDLLHLYNGFGTVSCSCGTTLHLGIELEGEHARGLKDLFSAEGVGGEQPTEVVHEGLPHADHLIEVGKVQLRGDPLPPCRPLLLQVHHPQGGHRVDDGQPGVGAGVGVGKRLQVDRLKLRRAPDVVSVGGEGAQCHVSNKGAATGEQLGWFVVKQNSRKDDDQQEETGGDADDQQPKTACFGGHSSRAPASTAHRLIENCIVVVVVIKTSSIRLHGSVLQLQISSKVRKVRKPALWENHAFLWGRSKCMQRCTAQGGEVWLHLGDRQRPSLRALRAERARSEAAGVGGRSSEARVSRRTSYLSLAVHGTKRRGLTSHDLPRTSADEGLASGASEARGGGRFW
ncbi:hypothetical protein TYRP_015033, partial [Tyrophagus putrescentiae]